MLVQILSGLFFLASPWLVRWCLARLNLGPFFSDVVVCFVVGLLLGNSARLFLSDGSFELVAGAGAVFVNLSVLWALPMLLMISDLQVIRRHASPLMIGFLLCLLATVIAAALSVWLFSDLGGVYHASAMLTGVYVGGTPNMMAVKFATNASEDLFLVLMASDMLCAGLYFLFLTTFAQRFFQYLLPSKEKSITYSQGGEEAELIAKGNKGSRQHLYALLKAVFLSSMCVLLALLVAYLFPGFNGEINEMLLIVALSVFGLLLSLFKKVRDLDGVYDFAQYLLLIFAVSVGMMADFEYLTGKGIAYLQFNAFFLFALIVIHLLFARLFKMNADSFIVSATACIFGPPFIGQVCAAIRNRNLISAGIAVGVLGLVVGNYLGVFIFQIFLKIN